MKKSKEDIVEGIDNLIKGNLLADKKISVETLIPWRFAILITVDINFSKLKTRFKPFKSNPFLKQIEVISCLQAPQKKFVVVPIDKTSNNFVIICELYFVEMILNEIDIIGLVNCTYYKANKNCVNR